MYIITLYLTLTGELWDVYCYICLSICPHYIDIRLFGYWRIILLLPKLQNIRIIMKQITNIPIINLVLVKLVLGAAIP